MKYTGASHRLIQNRGVFILTDKLECVQRKMTRTVRRLETRPYKDLGEKLPMFLSWRRKDLGGNMTPG